MGENEPTVLDMIKKQRGIENVKEEPIINSKRDKKVLNQAEVKEVKVKLEGQGEGKVGAIIKQVEKPNEQPVKKKIVVPNKVINKVETQAFTITLNKQLVKKLNTLYKKKGYKNRNELIGVMLELIIDNMEE